MNQSSRAAAHFAARTQWPRLLTALPAQQVRHCAARLSENLQIADVLLPQSGLGLMQMRDSARNEPYFIGEVPLSRAHVRLTDRQGRTAEGAAQLMDDRVSLARAVAILDAIKAAGWPGCEEIDALLEAGAIQCRQIEEDRRAMLTKTQVSFALLESTEEEEDPYV
jgi:alpha-D-ribose 1-methylphosphonate 5-triphosphate synthase subunit PhnG